MKKQFSSLVRSAISEVHEGISGRKEIYSNPLIMGKHDFLFFLKPEITLQSNTIQLDLILEMILDKIAENGLQIKNAVLLPAEYLSKHNIIAQHYGVINAIARNAKENLSQAAKEKFIENFGVDINDAKIFGGIELISAFPTFTPQTVDYLWQNSPTVKLGGGAYCQALKFDGQPIYLVNGFHPRQLEHFIAPGRSIVAFTLTGNTSWKIARNNFIGKTNPQEAENGSIRQILFEKMEQFGLSAVNSSWNGVHLSAGPVEGLVELIRYNTDFDSDTKLRYTNFSFGQELASNFNQQIIQEILSNSQVIFESKETNIFDVTEERDAEEAIKLLKKIYKK